MVQKKIIKECGHSSGTVSEPNELVFDCLNCILQGLRGKSKFGPSWAESSEESD